MFDFDNFVLPVISEYETKNIKIFFDSIDKVYYLYSYDEKMMTEKIDNFISSKEMYSSYDLAYGRVLLSGLGFGILQKMLNQKTSIESITIIEKNPEIIEAFLQNNSIASNVKIICEDINDYQSNDHFDCILLDHYEMQSLEDQLINMRKLSKSLPEHDVFFAWRTELIYLDLFLKNYNIFRLPDKWGSFLDFAKIKTMPNLTKEKVQEYAMMYVLGVDKKTLFNN